MKRDKNNYYNNTQYNNNRYTGQQSGTQGPPPGYQPYTHPQGANTPAGKSKIVAGLLGILLGCFGVHNFYLGFKERAIAQLLITVLSLGFLSFVSSAWGLIEGIFILIGRVPYDAQGFPLRD